MKIPSERLNVGYGIVPLTSGVLAFLLAPVFAWIDTIVPNMVPGTFGLHYSNSPDMNRAAMFGMAGTILATTGVVFSLLTVPLSVASSQYGSRLLRIFLRDRLTHTVLGVFVAAFMYCVRLGFTIPDDDTRLATPQISITIGFLLGLTSFASMLALIGHIGDLLQAPNLVAIAGRELQAVIRSYVPPATEQPRESPGTAERGSIEAALAQRVEWEGLPVAAEGIGYVQEINPKMVHRLSGPPDMVIHLVRKPGDFIHPGDLIARIWPPQVANPQVLRLIRDAYRLGTSRSPVQDIVAGVSQLTEVALRAMSPAINDPFTAMTCLHHLGAGVALFAATFQNRVYFYDAQEKLRIIMEPLAFSDLLDASFDMLRHACRDNRDVLICMVDTIDTISLKATLAEQRAELARHIRQIDNEAQGSSCIQGDVDRVRHRCAQVLATLNDHRDSAITIRANSPCPPER